MNKYRLLFQSLFFIILLSANIVAQSITGLWEFEEVKVGEQTVTPQAKWTRINDDGTYQSGNGWLQNSEGKWTYNDKEHSFLPIETNGFKDNFGAFEVSFEKGNMIWTRSEDGNIVVIKLKKIKEIPKGPADKIVGLWDLKSVEENGKDVTKEIDPNNLRNIFIRWDGNYIQRSAKGERKTGYWHMHGHRPDLTFLSHTQGEEPQNWSVSFENGKMMMEGLSGNNLGQKLIYERLTEFPK